jgi:outer membrane protein OmpA-like peptidoglycan-associated protein
MRTLAATLFAVALVSPSAFAAVETEMPGVTAELLELRQQGGVLRLAIRLTNGSSKAASSERINVEKITLVDAKSKKKYFPLKDANGQYVAGPIGDWIGGGRIVLAIPPGKDTVLWALFEPVAPGSVVNVEVPSMFPFDKVPVTDGAGTLFSGTTARSTPGGANVTLVSADRADQAVRVRLKVEGEPKARLRTPYFQYADVYLFDPASKRKYPLLKGGDGLYQAEPLTQKMGGGSFLLNFDKPTLVTLTFQAPPDTVRTADLALPQFLPFEGVALVGEGGAGAGGVAAAGRSVGLEGALKELQAEVTPEEIKIDLSADVLFDFDKADLKPAAEEKLKHLLTVVNGKPGSKVAIEGHTDVRGEEGYNQALSQRRAESVRAWLVAQGVAADRLTATGAGESRPVRSGTTEADHQANRRVEIRIRT